MSKLYVITGVTRGIGRSLARLLLDRGDAVWGCGRSAPVDEEWTTWTSGERFRYIPVDLSRPAEIDRLIREVSASSRTIDAVVLNAGVRPGTLDPSTIEINLVGHVRLVTALLEQETPPQAIYACESLFHVLPDVRDPAYAASKAGLFAFMESLMAGPHGGRTLFGHLVLGPVRTDMPNRFPGLSLDVGQAARTILSAMDRGRSATYVCKYPIWTRLALSCLPRRILRAMSQQMVS